jgi:hypothetical protein
MLVGPMTFLSATEALSFFYVFLPLRISQSGCAEFHGLIIVVLPISGRSL